jgi:hypothetical protein
MEPVSPGEVRLPKVVPLHPGAPLTKTFEADALPVRVKLTDETLAGPPATVSVNASSAATQPAVMVVAEGLDPAATTIDGGVTVTVVPAEEVPETVKPLATTVLANPVTLPTVELAVMQR